MHVVKVARETKVEKLNAVRVGPHEHVAWLEVVMHNAVALEDVQRVAQLGAETQEMC